MEFLVLSRRVGDTVDSVWGEGWRPVATAGSYDAAMDLERHLEGQYGSPGPGQPIYTFTVVVSEYDPYRCYFEIPGRAFLRMSLRVGAPGGPEPAGDPPCASGLQASGSGVTRKRTAEESSSARADKRCCARNQPGSQI